MKVCRDAGFVREFMNLPEIYRYAAEYMAPPIEPKYSSKEFWLSYHVDNNPVGLINLYVITGSACQFHPYILREYRQHYESMVRALFRWFCENMPPEAIKLNAIIPTMFKETIEIAKKVGGKVEGVDRMSYRRTKNRIYDRILLGITREEMEKCLK